jgi:hypothetical protein
LAAPSSPIAEPPGRGSWCAKRLSSGKIARRIRAVVGGSRERWSVETRFAGVRWTRPSVVSALGATVAALAAHMADADAHEARSRGLRWDAEARTWASVPE